MGIIANGVNQGTSSVSQNMGGSNWCVSDEGTYATTSTFTVTDNATNQASFAKGTPIRYKGAGSYLYAQVTNYATGTVTVRGAAVPNPITVMEFGNMNRLYEPLHTWAFLGAAADAASTALFSEDHLIQGGLVWQGAEAYIVGFTVNCKEDDSGANQPRFNISVGGNKVCTSNSNNGLEIIDVTEVKTVVDINTTNYELGFEDAIEVTTDANGSNNNAKDIVIRPIIIIV